MNRHAKATSAGSTMRQATGLGRIIRGAPAGVTQATTTAPSLRSHPNLAVAASSTTTAPGTTTNFRTTKANSVATATKETAS